MRIILLPTLAALLIGCGSSDEPTDNSNESNVPVEYTYRVINEYPHDGTAFTQGLVFEDGFLYEGTGSWGASELRKVVLETGEIVQRVSLPDSLFGEGITVLDNKIYQLTYLRHVVRIWSFDTFDSLGWLYLPTQGWGLTDDGRNVIVSDGSDNLYLREPETFSQLTRIPVRDHRGPVDAINELEYINGEVWANLWRKDYIARISPSTGQVLGYVRLAGIVGPEDSIPLPDGVMNGIAYDADNDRLFVTGKYWPKLFEIEVIPVGE
jgi:glutamine cyclotransferase